MSLLFEIRFLDVLDILIVAFLAHRLWVWIRGTRAQRILIGLLAIGFVSFLAVRYRLSTTAWIFTNLWTVLLLLILIVFQPEIRRMLERANPLKLLSGRPAGDRMLPVNEISSAMFELAASRVGAIIVIQVDEQVGGHLTGGLALDGRLSRQVLVGLFQKEFPVHDGAVLIQGDRIVSVGNYLPLTDREGLAARMGTRHRAALGLSEACDALVVVVSEENGAVSAARNGRLVRCADADALEAEFRKLPPVTEAPRTRWDRWGRPLVGDPAGKAGALLFSVILWGFFAVSEDFKKTVSQVPISYRFAEGLVPVGALREKVEVDVTGNRVALARLRPGELALSLDLSPLGRGSHTVDLTEAETRGPMGIRVISIDPRKVTVSLDKVETRLFAVEVRRGGNLGREWALREISTKPPHVTLTGLSLELDRVTSVETDLIDLSEVEGTWEGRSPVLVKPPGLRLDAIEPEGVMVQVKVVSRGS